MPVQGTVVRGVAVYTAVSACSPAFTAAPVGGFPIPCIRQGTC